MSIFRISLEQGLDLPSPEVFNQYIGEVVLHPPVEPQLLEPGEYSLKPVEQVGPLYNHQLIVHPNGHGLYRAIPLENTGSTYFRTEKGTTKRKGGIVASLPEDQKTAVIVGYNKAARLCIFEIINYVA